MTQSDLVFQSESSQETSVSKFNAWFLPYARQSLTNWRARHPLKRVVEPLPEWMHTHTEPPPMTDYEARQRAEWEAWDRLMGL